MSTTVVRAASEDCQKHLCVAVSRHSNSLLSIVSKTEVKFILYAAMMARGGGRIIVVVFLFNLSARWACVVCGYPHAKIASHLCKGTRYPLYRWSQGAVRTRAENFALTGIRSPNPPVHIESLYPLNYSGPLLCKVNIFNRKC